MFNPSDFLNILGIVICQVDDSALTGELDPHKVSADRSDETNALDAYNLIFMSSYAIQGVKKVVRASAVFV